jgi:hypothetical protein
MCCLPVAAGKSSECILDAVVEVRARSLDPIMAASLRRASQPFGSGKLKDKGEIRNESASCERIRCANARLVESTTRHMVGIRRKKEAVHDYNYTAGERGVNLGSNDLGPRSQEQQRLRLRRDVSAGIQQELTYGVAKRRPARLAEGQNGITGALETIREETDLSRLAGSFRPFEDDQHSRVVLSDPNYLSCSGAAWRRGKILVGGMAE